MDDADYIEFGVGHPKECAVIAVDMQAQTRTDPTARNAGVAKAGDAVKIGDQRRDEAFGGDGAIGSYVVIDVVEIGLGRVGNDESAGIDSDISFKGCRSLDGVGRDGQPGCLPVRQGIVWRHASGHGRSRLWQRLLGH